MPLFPYLPVIIWAGLIDAMLDVTSRNRDEPGGQSAAMITGADIVPFPRRNWVRG
jgi:hypothetical protein